MGFHKSGDWQACLTLLGAASRGFKHSVDRAVRQEAHYLRTLMIQGITQQAPGGTAIRPLAKLTLAKRRLKRFDGTKALLVRGDLRNSIAVALKDDGAFVGVLRTARGQGGEGLVNVAKVQEFGSGPTIVPLTPRMRWYLIALLRKAGIPRSRTLGKGRGYIILTVPPRPFLRPAWAVFQKGLADRFAKQLSGLLGGVE